MARPAGVAKGIVLVVTGSPEHEPHLEREAVCRVQDRAYGAAAANDHLTIEIGADGRGPAWKHCGSKLYDIQLGLMDMDMLVDKTGRQILARCIDDNSIRADGVVDVSHRSDAIPGHSDISWVDLAGKHIDEPTASDDEVGRLPAHRHIDGLQFTHCIPPARTRTRTSASGPTPQQNASPEAETKQHFFEHSGEMRPKQGSLHARGLWGGQSE